MKGMGFYLLVLGLIIAAMLISDNLYNSHQEVYNEVMFQEDLQSGKITGVEIYQNVEAPTGEIQIAVKTGEGEEIKSFYQQCRKYRKDFRRGGIYKCLYS